MKVDGSLKSLLQGVSQQPPRDRLPGQCTEQINMSSDPVEGLTNRAPLDFVEVLGGVRENGVLAKSSWFEFTTRDGNKWLAQFTNEGAVQVRDLNGVLASLSGSDAATNYIRGFTGNLKFAILDERVYVVNPDVVTRMNPTPFPYWNRPGAAVVGIVSVLGGAYGRRYSISIDGVERAFYVTPDGSEASHALFATTTNIAQNLQGMLDQNMPDNYAVIRQADVISIYALGANPFSISCSDGAGNINMKAMGNQVKSVADLPRFAHAGQVVRIATHANPEDDLYYVFKLEQNAEDMSGNGFGLQGYWQESVAPSTPINFQWDTLPMALDYNPATKSFYFDQVKWESRKVGSSVSNPDPSFIGNKVTDVGIFQGRLVFTAGDSVTMSRTNKHNDFWIRSLEELADNDPIDVSSNSVEAAAMGAVVPHNKDLVVFSAKGQFIVYGRTSITPKNAALVLTTSFEAELSAKPVPAGRNVFFATNYGKFTNLREFYTEGGTDINDTRPITQHVRKYIKGKVTRMAATSNYDTLLVATDEDRNVIYVYQYIWSDNEKVQSSWAKWEFNAPVQYMFFDEELVYFILETSNGYTLMRMSLDKQDLEGVGYVVALDGRFDVFNCDRAFILPAGFYLNNKIVCVQAKGCPNPGLLAEIESITNSPGVGVIVRLKQSMNGGNLLVGNPYMRQYWPTLIGIKDSEGTVMSTGKLRVKHYLVTVQETGELTTQVVSPYYDSAPIKFEGRVLGEPINAIGKQPLYNGTLIVPFRDNVNNAELVFRSDSHLPHSMLDIEWAGQYTKKGRRMSSGGN